MSELIGLIKGRPNHKVQSAAEFYGRLFGTDHDHSYYRNRAGFTIVFVSDGSERCDRFLPKHLADIYLSGSPRAPIVLFSRLDLAEGNAVADHVGWNNRGRAFLIPVLGLEMIKHPECSLGWRTRDVVDWISHADRLLHPHGETLRRMDFEESRRLVVFGSDEAGWFARRFGLSADVPCFVMLTEFKGLSCQMIPFPPEDETGDGVSKLLKEWIAAFSSAHTGALRRCEAIEVEIGEISSNARQSRDSAKNWPIEVAKAWQKLGGIAGVEDLITRLEPGDLDQLERICTGLGKDSNLPYPIGGAVRKALEGLPKLRISRTLRLSRNPGELRECLRNVPESLRGGSLAGFLSRGSAGLRDLWFLESRGLGDDVSKHIRRWWWQAIKLTPCHLAFRRACTRSNTVINPPWIMSESPSLSLREKFARMVSPVPPKLAADPMEGLRVVNHAMAGQKIGTTPAAMADCVIQALSLWCGEDLTAAKWGIVAGEVRDHISGRWSQLQALTEGIWFGAELAELSAEVIYPVAPNDAVDADRKPTHPALIELTARIDVLFASRRQVISHELEHMALRLRDELLTLLWQGETLTDIERTQAIQADLLTGCKDAVFETEKKINGLLEEMEAEHPFENEAREALRKLLAEHSGMLDTIVVPFQKDSRFRKIQLDLRKIKREVCGDLEPSAGSAARVARKVRKAENQLAEAEAEWRKVRENFQTLGPVPHLMRQIMAILPGARIDELVPQGLSGSLEDRIGEMLIAGRGRVLLDRMKPQELLMLVESLVLPDFKALITLAEPLETAGAVLYRLGALPTGWRQETGVTGRGKLD